MKNHTLNKIDLQGSINIPHLWKGILDSYHNYYDIFSELIQNSVDSVRKSNNAKPQIQISFDNSTQKIIVRDNGIGMSEEDLKFFALGNTNKSEDNEQIGEKGLGASFILGISDVFKLKSIKNGAYIEAECLDANKDIRAGKIPTLTYRTSSEKKANFCEIEVTISSIDINIDDVDEFIFILRTRTALGNTNNLFLEKEEREEIDITYTFTNVDRIKKVGKIPFLYLHFDELVEGEYPIFDAFYIKRSRKWTIDTSEIEKKPRGILRLIDYDNKIYVTFGQYDIYKKIGMKIGRERYPDDIAISIKGCPSSVHINKPRLGNQGYYTNLHILINDDDYVLDAGRKTIRRKDADDARSKIKSFFNDVVNMRKYFMDTPHDSIGEGAGLDQVKERARNTPSLNIKKIPFAKIPRHEQSVVGIFHEMLGAKLLNGYNTLLVSQYNTFDLLFDYIVPIDKIGKNPKKIYIKGAGKGEKEFRSISFGEFKLELGRFCKDVDLGIKGADHVNLIISWEVGKIPNGWELRKIFSEERIYDGANYIIEKIGHKKFHAIVLKDFVEKNN